MANPSEFCFVNPLASQVVHFTFQSRVETIKKRIADEGRGSTAWEVREAVIDLLVGHKGTSKSS
jgi:hypothetical protein